MQPLTRRRHAAAVVAAVAAAAAAAALAGCAATPIAGDGRASLSASAPAPAPTATVAPLRIDVVVEAGHVNVRDALIASAGDRAAFLRRFDRQPELRDTLAGFIDAAPPGSVVLAGLFDIACHPAGAAQVVVDGGRLALRPVAAGDDTAECYVPYSSYAVAALDRDSIPPGVLVD